MTAYPTTLAPGGESSSLVATAATVYISPMAPLRVLMICYYYPPVQAVGTTRSLAFSQNLQELGCDVTVHTVQDAKDPWVKSGAPIPDNIRIVRTPEWNLSAVADTLHGVCCKIAGLVGHDLKTNYFREFFCFPDPQIAWCKLRTALRLAKEHDVVYVSSSPFSSAITGALISIIAGKPVVLDFRDAWSLNPHVRHTWLHRKLIEIFERFAIKHSAKLILNTPGAERLYREKYPEYASRITNIPNGYDNLTPVETVPAGETFTIMHVGNYYGSRNPELLLEALAEINNPNIEFVQVGGPIPNIEKYQSRVCIRTIPPVPREKALELMKSASLLYLKQGFEPGITNYIAVAAKTYEYLATGLPILAEVPPGDNADIVREYSQASQVVTEDRVSTIKDCILHCYNSRNAIVPGIDSRYILCFSRHTLAVKLESIFKDLAPASTLSSH